MNPLSRTIHGTEPTLYISDLWNEIAIGYWLFASQLAIACNRPQAYLNWLWRAAMRRGKRTTAAWEVFDGR